MSIYVNYVYQIDRQMSIHVQYLQKEHDHPNICYQTHLLSTQLQSHSFAIKPHLPSGLNCFQHICYQAMHLLSGQFVINPQQQSTILLSIIICYQILTSYQSLFLTFFCPKNLQQMEKFSTFGILHSLKNFVWAWNRLILLPQVKVSTF